MLSKYLNYDMFNSGNFRRSFKSWKTERCNKVSGGEGSQFPPGVEEEEALHLFIPDICRHVKVL
jgi:hypothetical protein